MAQRSMDSQPIILDATDLKCPLPVLKARRILRDLVPGKVLEILATDAGAPKDFEHFCKSAGHEFLFYTIDDDGTYRIFLRRGSG